MVEVLVQLVSNVLVLLVLEAQVLALEVLAVESEDGLLISTDEQTWRHVLGHHVQPRSIEGWTLPFPWQRQCHDDHLCLFGVLPQHLS